MPKIAKPNISFAQLSTRTTAQFKRAGTWSLNLASRVLPDSILQTRTINHTTPVSVVNPTVGTDITPAIQDISSSMQEAADVCARAEGINAALESGAIDPLDLDEDVIAERSAQQMDQFQDATLQTGGFFETARAVLQKAFDPYHTSSFASQTGAVDTTTLITLTAGTAAALAIFVGLSHFTIPVVLGSVALATFGYASFGLSKIPHGHSNLKKLFEFASRKAFPFLVLENLGVFTYLASKAVDSDFFRLMAPGAAGVSPMGTTSLVVMGALFGTWVLGRVGISMRQFLNSRMGHVEAPDKSASGMLLGMSIASVFAKVNFLSLRTILFGAAGIGLAGISLSTPATVPFLLVGSALTSAWFVRNHTIERLIGRDLTQVLFSRNPIGQLVDPKSLWLLGGIALGSIPIALLSGNPAALFFFPSLFFSGWALAGDFHSGLPAIGSAINHVRSLFAPSEPLISDAYKGSMAFGMRGRGTGRNVMLLKAYMNNQDANLTAVLVNALINSYPNVEFELCEEINWWGRHSNRIVKARRGRQGVEMAQAWQSEVYDGVHSLYEARTGQTATDAQNLIDHLRHLGELFCRDEAWTDTDGTTHTPYIERIKQALAADAQREKQWQLFDHNLAPEFYAEVLTTLRYRAENFFFPLAEELEEKLAAGEMTADEVALQYQRLLDLYNIRFNYIIRRLEQHDDQYNTKLGNLGSPQSHVSDTLYPVWALDTRGGRNFEQAFTVEYVPGKWIRVRNPNWNHRTPVTAADRQDPNFYQFFWVNRDAVPNIIRHSRSNSEEIELLSNNPDGVSWATPLNTGMSIHGNQLGAGQVYATNTDAALPVTGMQLRDYTPENGTTAAQRLGHKYLWMPGTQRSRLGTVDDHHEATLEPLADPDQFDSHFRSLAVAQYAGGNRANYDAMTGGNLWWVAEPEMLDFIDCGPQDGWFISDEEYVDIMSNIQLQAELRHESERHKNLRLFRYHEQTHDLPNPLVGHTPTRIERLGSPIDVVFRLKNGEEYLVPYEANRTMLPNWAEITHCRPRVEGGQVMGLTLYSQREDGTYHEETEIAQKELPWPMPPLDELSNDGNDYYEFNLYSYRTEERVGMYGYYRFEYDDDASLPEWQRVRFVKEEQKPFHFWANLVTQVELSEDGTRVTVTNRFPEAQIVPFDDNWMDIGNRTDENAPRTEVLAVDGSGEKWVAQYQRTDGTIYFDWAPSESTLPPGYMPDSARHTRQILGLVKYTDPVTGEQRETVAPLSPESGHFGLGNPRNVRNVVEGRVHTQQNDDGTVGGNIEVIQGTPVRGIAEKASPYLYFLRDHQQLVDPQGNPVTIPDFTWIEDTTIVENPDGNGHVVVVTCRNPFNNSTSTHHIDSGCLVDQDGKDFLDNSSRGMIGFDSFFQGDANAYTPQTARYRPQLVTLSGRVGLVMHKTDNAREHLELPPELLQAVPTAALSSARVFLAEPTSAVKVRRGNSTRWVPLTLVDPIGHTDEAITQTTPHETTNHTHQPLTFKPSDLVHGDFGHAVHRQPSFGGIDAAQYRDGYFYGRYLGPFSEMRPMQGEANDRKLVIALQQGKLLDFDANGVSHSAAIENGTPFWCYWETLDDLVEITRAGTPRGGEEYITRHPFAAKHVPYAIELGWLAGVSEDEQLNMALTYITGRRLFYGEVCTAIVAQPNKPDALIAQNQRRYNTSTQLKRDVGIPYVLREYRESWLTNSKEPLMTPKEMFETLLSASWYDVPYAEFGRAVAPVAYLFSGGRVMPYPVDQWGFIGAWAADFTFGMGNYISARRQGGFPWYWSAWKGPLRDPVAQLGGYWRASRKMYDEDWQYGAFSVTAMAKSSRYPMAQKRFVGALALGGGVSVTLGAVAFAMGLGSLGVNPITLALLMGIGLNVFWGSFMTGLQGSALRWLNKYEVNRNDNPVDVAPVIEHIEDILGGNNPSAIIHHLNARTMLAETLESLGYNSFDIDSGASNPNQAQIGKLLPLAERIDYGLYREAKALAQSSDLTERCLAYSILTDLANRSFRHTVAVMADRARKRIDLGDEHARCLAFQQTVAKLGSATPKDLDDTIIRISAIWRTLSRTARKSLADDVKALRESIRSILAQRIADLSGEESTAKFIEVISAVESITPLLGKRAVKKLKKQIAAALSKEFDNLLELAKDSKKDLERLYYVAVALGNKKLAMRVLEKLAEGAVGLEKLNYLLDMYKLNAYLNLNGLTSPRETHRTRARIEKQVNALIMGKIEEIKTTASAAQRAKLLKELLGAFSSYTTPHTKFLGKLGWKLFPQLRELAFEAAENPEELVSFIQPLDKILQVDEDEIYSIQDRGREKMALDLRRRMLGKITDQIAQRRERKEAPAKNELAALLFLLRGNQKDANDLRAVPLAQNIRPEIEKLLEEMRNQNMTDEYKAGVKAYMGALNNYINNKHQRRFHIANYHPSYDVQPTAALRKEKEETLADIESRFPL